MDRTRVITPTDPDWPRQLDALGKDAPQQLWLRGSPGAFLDWLTQKSVAIVGARACTAYGQHVATEIAYGLALEERTVVSGGALGIDVAAHRGALGGKHPTVVVLPCGVDVPYPSAHRATFEHIIEEGGLLVSEYGPGDFVSRTRFLERNRIIAALAGGMVLVEANVRSGSLNAFGLARRLGRTLMAVPGPVTSAMSNGTLAALREGAVPVGDEHDVIDAMDWERS